ncbi:hypothetical protein [Corynebacterium pseudopelargi]|uniref:Secreted protein n=1 Tax=Corynebacterium pseudopelargi TaxID=2080757 RepID=A0A3G6IWC0_9CORY|nr:hypothetical protein [Corynebacterium pseudopelargi]AZA08958.1 hypothetical protein CPPEL_04155 [Corynebacterium pseudopelargi]
MTQQLNIKALVAVPMIAALALAACGSEEEAEQATSSVTTTKTSTSTATPTKESSEPSEEASEEEQGPTEGPTVGAEALDEPPATVQRPESVEAPEFADFEPVEGGQPASEEDRAAIEALVRGQDEQVGFRDYLSYVPNHTCSRVKDQSDPDAYDLSQLPNTPIKEDPQFAAGNPHTESVSDVMVNGDEASATVVAVSKGEQSKRTMRFHREDGKWTFCN